MNAIDHESTYDDNDTRGELLPTSSTPCELDPHHLSCLVLSCPSPARGGRIINRACCSRWCKWYSMRQKKNEYIPSLTLPKSRSPSRAERRIFAAPSPATVARAALARPLARPHVYAEIWFPPLPSLPTHSHLSPICAPNPAFASPHTTALHTLPIHSLNHRRGLLHDLRHLVPNDEVILIHLHALPIHKEPPPALCFGDAIACGAEVEDL